MCYLCCDRDRKEGTSTRQKLKHDGLPFFFPFFFFFSLWAASQMKGWLICDIFETQRVIITNRQSCGFINMYVCIRIRMYLLRDLHKPAITSEIELATQVQYIPYVKKILDSLRLGAKRWNFDDNEAYIHTYGILYISV